MTTRRWYAIAAAGVLLAILAVVMRPSPPGSAATPRTTQAAAGRSAARAAGVADVRLEILQRFGGAPPRPGRDVFRFRPRAVPPAPRLAQAPILPSVFTGPPPPPPIALRFIGLVETAQRAGRVALLSDGRGSVMHGREGDMVEGRYRVLRVGTDAVELAYADGRGRQTIRLSGQ